MSPKTLTRPSQSTGEMQKVQLQENCVHYWVIEPPADMVSRGVCKKCGAQKKFDNFITADKDWK